MRDLINIVESKMLTESYQRVIPRDLFNDANLLKCYGQIYINLEPLDVDAKLVERGDMRGFHIERDDSSGATFVANVHLIVRGQPVRLERPMNSRQPYPLYMVTEDYEEITVFEQSGQFSAEFVAFLEGSD